MDEQFHDRRLVKRPLAREDEAFLAAQDVKYWCLR
jgi:hypothetical protein